MERVYRVLAPVLPGAEQTPRGDLASVLRAGHPESLLEQDELTVFSGVVAFAERPVREVMTPRADVVAVPERASIHEIGRFFGESGYSRLPVYRDSVDNIVGMFYAFDVIKVAPAGRLPLRPILAVPGSKRCADLLYDMQHERRQFAVVLDEFGGTAGIATLEDLLEELVGEIFDEHDAATPAESPAPDLVEADGATVSGDIAARFGVDLPGEAETVGGLLSRHLGRIPATGERFLLAGLEFDVVAATPTRVERVVIRRGPVAPVPLGSGGRS
jgi:CBS domain containing-hemolysin-like protein